MVKKKKTTHRLFALRAIVGTSFAFGWTERLRGAGPWGWVSKSLMSSGFSLGLRPWEQIEEKGRETLRYFSSILPCLSSGVPGTFPLWPWSHQTDSSYSSFPQATWTPGLWDCYPLTLSFWPSFPAAVASVSVATQIRFDFSVLLSGVTNSAPLSPA